MEMQEEAWGDVGHDEKVWAQVLLKIYNKLRLSQHLYESTNPKQNKCKVNNAKA